MADLDIKCNRCSAPLAHQCGGPDLLTAIKQLYKFIPESGTPKAVITEGKKNGMWGEDDDPEDLPFFTETFLYALLGKEDARTLLALVRRLIEASGIEAWKVEHQAWHELAQEEAIKAYSKTRQEAIRQRVKRNNKRMCTCGHPYEVHHSTDASPRVRICTKCQAKCAGYSPASAKDKLETGLPDKDRAVLQVLKDQLIELQKDPDEEREERRKKDWIREIPAEEQLAKRIKEILEDEL